MTRFERFTKQAVLDWTNKVNTSRLATRKSQATIQDSVLLIQESLVGTCCSKHSVMEMWNTNEHTWDANSELWNNDYETV
jgi:hypothetical protein